MLGGGPSRANRMNGTQRHPAAKRGNKFGAPLTVTLYLSPPLLLLFSRDAAREGRGEQPTMRPSSRRKPDGGEGGETRARRREEVGLNNRGGRATGEVLLRQTTRTAPRLHKGGVKVAPPNLEFNGETSPRAHHPKSFPPFFFFLFEEKPFALKFAEFRCRH